MSLTNQWRSAQEEPERVETVDGDSEENASGLDRDVRNAYARFVDLLKMAEEQVALGKLSSATALCHIAARCAYPANVGIFGSPRLERLLLAIGRQLKGGRDRLSGSSPEKLNIAHVLSYGRPVGGDSRFVWRWIQADTKNRHHVILTSQADIAGMYDVPEILKRAAEESGGYLETLSAPTANPLDQASELRAVCQKMDFVVLHLFPYDIVPVLALAAGCESTKVLFVNHSDHTFWVGASVADIVVNLRQQASDFLISRRGVDPLRCTMLPIPLPACSLSTAIRGRERNLSLKPKDSVLLVTIASPFKYSSPGHVSFLELVTPVVTAHPSVRLIAVGPDPEDPAWRLASEKTAGRITARGSHWDNDELYAAADIYLDSVPFSSITSLLEAGSRGVPILAYRAKNPNLGLMGPGAPGLDKSVLTASDAGSYRFILNELITRPETRRRAGGVAREQILKYHEGENWRKQIEGLYRTDFRRPRGCILGTDTRFEVEAFCRALVRLYPKVNSRQLIAKYLRPLPYADRSYLSWRLFMAGFGLCFLNLLPPSIEAVVRTIGHGIRKRIVSNVVGK